MYSHASVQLNKGWVPTAPLSSLLLLYVGFIDANYILPQSWNPGHQQL